MLKKPLTITILISAMTHMAVFFAWWHNQQQLTITTTLQGSPLNVSITQTSKPLPTTTQKSEQAPERKQHTPSIPGKDSLITPQTENKSSLAKNNAVTTESDKPQKTKNKQPTIDNNETLDEQVAELALLNNNMVEYLSSEFKVRFKYPHLARKRGWQGEVLLKLDINRQGKISHIFIARSSGYKLLDLNAVRTFQLIGELSPILKKELLEDHHLSIPVSYQLTGS